MQLSLSRKALLIVIVPLAAQLIFIFGLGYLLRQVELEAQRIERSRAIINEANILSKLAYDAATALIAYNISKTRIFENSYKRSVEQISEELRLLRRLLNETPDQVQRMDRIETLMKKGLSLMSETKNTSDSVSAAGIMADMRKLEIEETIRELVAEIDNVITLQKDAEKAQPISESSMRQIFETFLIVGIFLNIAIAIFMVAVFNRSISRRLSVLFDNTIRLARGDTLTPPLPGNDELSQLDQTFRVMALTLDESTKQQTAIIENASDVICSIDKKNAFSHVSAASFSVWGFTPDELIGKRVQEIIFEDDVEATMHSFNQVTESKTTDNIHSRVKRKDGVIIHILWSVQWSESEKSLFCVAHDITQAKEAEQFKQDFMEMVSHDIRTPLTSVTATLQMMEMGIRTGGNEKDIRIARRNIAQIISLLNELLDVHKMEAGRLELDLEPIDARRLVSEAIETVKAYAEREKVSISEPSNTAIVDCDADRIRQVIVNLLSNAIKFSPADSTIETSIERLDNLVTISVSDSGPGVPEEFKEAIFDRFKQVRKSDETQKGGKGLGLYICKSIVEQHGGLIGVESEPGKGSRFWIRLALSADEK